MSKKITKDILESYLYCKTKAQLKLDGQRGSKSDYESMVLELKDEVRAKAVEKIMSKTQEEDIPRHISLTTPLLKKGTRYILDAMFEDDHFSLSFDGLKRVEGASKLGDFHYVPILFQEGGKIDKEQRQLMELYGLLLSRLQKTMPNHGVIWNGVELNSSRVRLGRDLRKTEQILRNVRESMTAESLPVLILNDHCQICEYQKRCRDQAMQEDNLSLLPRMSEKEILKLNRRGIFTITQLSCTFRPRKKSKKLRLNQYRHQNALKALAIRENKIFVHGPVEVPESQVQIFLDIEADREGAFVYLIGVIVVKDDIETHYSFWADSKPDEEKIVNKFLDIIKQNDEFCLYCYGSYELKFLRRIQNNVSEQPVIEKVLTHSCNVLSAIYSHGYFPTYSNSLKDIGRYLGFSWTEDVQSGINSVVWRKTWERTQQQTYKQKLIAYNLEDCMALRAVTSCLHSLALPDSALEQSVSDSPEANVSRVEELEMATSRPEWERATFSIPDLEFINDRAYFDYQRDRVYIRTSKTLKKNQKGKSSTGITIVKPTHTVEVFTEECPFCHSKNLLTTSDKRLHRISYDLVFSSGAIRRKIVQYTTAWHHCEDCKQRFLPPIYRRLAESFHGLNSWIVYQLVRHRLSYESVNEMLNEFFGLPFHKTRIPEIKSHMAQRYRTTYNKLWQKLLTGPILHVDETEVTLRNSKKVYVWVFTNMEEVVFMLRDSREGGFLKELLADFRGVLITDFYAAYDSLDCEQQKCLIHLIRDMNEDLKRNPWDDEFKLLIGAFGKLIRTIVTTVDQYGLKRRHLNKHLEDVERFYRTLKTSYRSDVAQRYYERLTKGREKLFTFLKHDGVPWNNNNAEHAIKQFQ